MLISNRVKAARGEGSASTPHRTNTDIPASARLRNISLIFLLKIQTRADFGPR